MTERNKYAHVAQGILLSILILGLVGTSAFAVVDPDPDMLGVYFDENANINSIEDQPEGESFFAYFILTKPTMSAVWGFDFGYRVVVPSGMEDRILRLGRLLPTGSTPSLDDMSLYNGWYTIGIDPNLLTTEATVLVQWELMITAPIPIEFFLGASPFDYFEDGLPEIQSPSGQILPVGLSTGGPDIPVATVNLPGAPVAADNAAWGQIKAMFR